MREKTYAEKLKHPLWQKKRLEIMKRDNFTCKLCSDSETTLNVHHLEYINGNDPWDYENKYLITLCEHCHKEIENLKGNDEDFDFKKIKIYKSTGWTDGSMIIFISYNTKISMRIYDTNGKWIDGYNLSKYELIRIQKLIRHALNQKEDNLEFPS